ncbi:MAG TPA: SprT-like domain-containing protein [Nitrospiraceae bacterium]|nr:SprT-like domain-containing protein [Nitrospiraceae bacterium]
MTRPSPALPSVERLQAFWGEVNDKYFRGALPPIEIIWSRRLTSSAGMFVSRVGPRARAGDCAETTDERRVIRLSAPLLQRTSEKTEQAEREILSTLAHEMIHQWQFDVLKRRPNHGPDFSRKMATMNPDGLEITVCHRFDEAVQAFAKHAWQCRRCGKVYERQKRTIRPSRHRCGTCQGTLREVPPSEVNRGTTRVQRRRHSKGSPLSVQLELNLSLP